jgi:hypothetical protein
MPLLNYSTSIEPERSISDIQKRPVRVGATAILTEYDSDGVLCAMSFRSRHNGHDLMFRMPAKIDPIYVLLQNDRNVPRKLKTRAQAARVAWRIIKDWIEAQAAIIEADQAQLVEVFLPYAQNPNTGRTLFDSLADSGFKMLTHQP